MSLFALPSPLDRPEPAVPPLRLAPELSGSGPPGTPLVAVVDSELLDVVNRLADTVAVDLQVVDAQTAAQRWSDPGLKLVDAAVGHRLAALGLPRRPEVVVLARDDDDPAPWRVAVELGAEQVATLPEAGPWLAEQLAEGERGPQSPVVGVVGGCGGAGASTLASALAVVAARAGHRCLLVDLDPIGSGLDVLLGGDDAVGARWDDLADARGRVDSAALRGVLPAPAGVPVVTWRRDRGGPQLPHEAVLAAVVEAGRRASGLVVVDLPRRLPMPAPVVDRLTHVVVVVPARVRAAVAAGRLVSGAGLPAQQLTMVVRGPAPSGLTGDDVAAAAGLSDWIWLEPEPRRDEHEEHGVPPAGSARGPLATCCAGLIERLSVADPTR